MTVSRALALSVAAEGEVENTEGELENGADDEEAVAVAPIARGEAAVIAADGVVMTVERTGCAGAETEVDRVGAALLRALMRCFSCSIVVAAVLLHAPLARTAASSARSASSVSRPLEINSSSPSSLTVSERAGRKRVE